MPDPVPVLPELELPVLGELELGEDVEPLEELGEELELGEALEPLEDVSCSRRQRSFSVPVIVSHCVLLPTEGELEELPLVLGEVVLLEPPLAAEPVLELPLAPDDESAAMATVEAANSAASVAVESTFNIRASPL